MYCLKCGKGISQGLVFCEECQQEMDAFPVAPGTPVVIIPRSAPQPEKEQRRKRKSYADILRTYRKLVRSLCITLGVAILIMAVLVGCLVYTSDKLEAATSIGRNYTIAETNTNS